MLGFQNHGYREGYFSPDCVSLSIRGFLLLSLSFGVCLGEGEGGLFHCLESGKEEESFFCFSYHPLPKVFVVKVGSHRC